VKSFKSSISDRSSFWLRAVCLFLAVAMALPVAAREGFNRKTGLPEPRTHGRIKSTTGPFVDHTAHRRGRMELAIANNGTIGTNGNTIADPFTGEAISSCTYPANSDLVYLWVASMWIGAVVGRDTLVSVGDEDFYVTRELWPDAPPFGNFRYLSIDPNSPFYSPDAYSEEDIICEYTDTLTDPNYVNSDPYEGRPHRPLGIQVTQRSMAWSYSYADDFILFDYQVENISRRTLEDVYLGIWVDGDAWHITNNNAVGWTDDLVGFYPTHPAPEGYGFVDTVNIAYHADADGDPNASTWDFQSIPHVVGTRVVRTPAESLSYSFNWWIINYSDDSKDFGPRRIGTDDDPFRSFGSRLGTPEGDRNKYYIMSHPEFDYDQIYTAIDHTNDGWLRPPENADQIATGWDCRYLLSFGPFTIHPGQSLPVSFAWVGGEDFHPSPQNHANLFNPAYPDLFYGSLNFENLAANSRWASWVYDNPGVDSDSDGFAGKARIICADTAVVAVDTNIGGNDTTILVEVYDKCDTSFYEGDGVPDFVGAGPPPAPDFWVEPEVGRLRIRFNGQRSETTRDVFSGVVDFEGYRVYMSRDDRAESFSLMASYDVEDYNKWVLDGTTYVLRDLPYTIDELRCLYGESCDDENFDPLTFTRTNPYRLEGFESDSVFIFEAQDFNISESDGQLSAIRKVYPDQPYPSHLDKDSAQADELTEDGYFKYFEYECILDNLLPTVPYLLNVTAFDFGSPKSGLPSLESSYLNGSIEAYPLPDVEEVEERNLDIYVYPNPYRIDGSYADRGFENREQDQATERARLLHFANLPAKCTIRIYSLDGDLVRQIEHDVPPDDPTASHETWDLITRNTQAVVTGLYYWVVESSSGTQMGKFVIIK